MIMNNEQLIKQIDELIGIHRQLKTDGNDILSKVRSVLTTKSSDDYKKGLNDAWELAQKIGGVNHPDYYGGEELRDIFGSVNCTHVFNHYSYSKALAKVQEYEKKKAEESKLVPGDVVEFESMCYGLIKGIFIKYENNDSKILTRQGAVTLSGNNVWKITKTGDHVDISELIGVLGYE